MGPDDKELSMLLAQRKTPVSASDTLKARLHKIPHTYKQTVSAWQDLKATLFRPTPAVAFAATLVLGVWLGSEAEIMMALSGEDWASYMASSNVMEDWL